MLTLSGVFCKNDHDFTLFLILYMHNKICLFNADNQGFI